VVIEMTLGTGEVEGVNVLYSAQKFPSFLSEIRILYFG
jgi:hypothetical protein